MKKPQPSTLMVVVVAHHAEAAEGLVRTQQAHILVVLLHPVRNTEVLVVAEVGHHREARSRGYWSLTSRLEKQKQGIKKACQ